MKNHYRDIATSLPHSMKPTNDDINHPTLDEAVDHINNIDFSLIQEKLCSKDTLLSRQWSPTEAEIAIHYYKKFLFLNKKYLAQFPVLPPSLEVDEIWHHHILDTRQYIKDCEGIFGYYFHHYPYFGTRGEVDKINLDVAFNVTQTLYEAEFGSRMSAIWSDENEL